MSKHYFLKAGENLKTDGNSVADCFPVITCFDTDLKAQEIVAALLADRAFNTKGAESVLIDSNGQYVESIAEMSNSEFVVLLNKYFKISIYLEKSLVYISAATDTQIEYLTKILQEE